MLLEKREKLERLSYFLAAGLIVNGFHYVLPVHVVVLTMTIKRSQLLTNYE
jgi:hypothetical protein